MTQEYKKLLLVDLCARVPYHPKGHVVNAYNGTQCDEWLTCATFTMFTSITNNCRLYLRPMSSMTEEEKKEYNNLCDIAEVGYYEFGDLVTEFNNYDTVESIDYLNAHHFDYRGLIEKGLAIAVTKENNPYKE